MSVTLAGLSGPKETHHVSYPGWSKWGQGNPPCQLPWLVLVGPRKLTMSVTLAGLSGPKETHHVRYPGWS